MFNLPILDIAISLSFLYCLLSLFTSVVQEWIATLFTFRGHMLHEGLKRMLDDGHLPDMVESLYQHPLVRYMAREDGKGGKNPRPSHLSRATFLSAFRDLLYDRAVASGANPEASDREIISHLFKEGRSQLPESTLAVLEAFWNETEGNIKQFENRLVEWFDDTMDRVSGWYKHQSQHWAMGLGLGIAMLMNVDTLSIAKKLANDSQARQALTAQASAFAEAPQMREAIENERSRKAQSVDTESVSEGKPSLATMTHSMDSLTQMGSSLYKNQITATRPASGLGWFRDPKCDSVGICYPACLVYRTLSNEFIEGRPITIARPPISAFVFFMVFKILGYAATAFAIALGSPFWFDILQKLIKAKGSGKKPETT
jgi:hypothetical protein